MIQRNLLALLLSLAMIACTGCVGITATPDPQDDDSAADDDTGDDDSAADDDDSASTDDDDDVDDNSCDEGVDEEVVARFQLRDPSGASLVGAEVALHDLDAATGAVEADPIVEGVTDEEGAIVVNLSCEYGWLVMNSSHPDYPTAHLVFKLAAGTMWTMMVPDLASYSADVGDDIGAADSGILAVTKVGTDNMPDLQGEDEFRIDEGTQLVPYDAEDGVGMWIYDSAYGSALGGVWFVDYALPGGGTVVQARYDDTSAKAATVVYLPVYSYTEGDGTLHITTLEIRS